MQGAEESKVTLLEFTSYSIDPDPTSSHKYAVFMGLSVVT